jgi:hypothetical protein
MHLKSGHGRSGLYRGLKKSRTSVKWVNVPSNLHAGMNPAGAGTGLKKAEINPQITKSTKKHGKSCGLWVRTSDALGLKKDTCVGHFMFFV